MKTLTKAESLQGDSLTQVRAVEFEQILAAIPRGAVHVLELGAGDGSFARLLRSKGYVVTAIDLPSSVWADKRKDDVIDYNGVDIPLPNDSVDVVLSSHVMVQVTDFATLQKDIKRVLRKNGVCLHTLPTPLWRLLTTLASLPAIPRDLITCPPKFEKRRRLMPTPVRVVAAVGLVSFNNLRSGLRMRSSGHRTFIGEIFGFSASAWDGRFTRSGFHVVWSRDMGILYTGFYLFGPHLSIEGRRRLASVIGSSSRLYCVAPSS